MAGLASTCGKHRGRITEQEKQERAERHDTAWQSFVTSMSNWLDQLGVTVMTKEASKEWRRNAEIDHLMRPYRKDMRTPSPDRGHSR